MSALNIDNSFSGITSSLNNTEVASTADNDELGQSEFIELLVAQVKNQDPTKPMDPSQFMNQLAQFSTVNGIENLNSSFTGLADKLSSDQALQAANLVGRVALVPGGYGELEAGGSITGQLDLPTHSSDVSLTIFNEYGEQVKELSLGAQSQGMVHFQWDGFSDDGSVASPGDYTLIAQAYIDGSQQAVEVSLDKRIDSISLNQDGSGTTLNLASGESLPLSFVQQIK